MLKTIMKRSQFLTDICSLAGENITASGGHKNVEEELLQ
jgi:hypothetical protein